MKREREEEAEFIDSQDHHFDTKKVHPIPDRFKTRTAPKGSLRGFDTYQRLYNQSVNDPEKFWTKQAKDQITWFRPFTQLTSGGFSEGNIAWFINGKLNVCYNCIDRHIERGNGNKVAIIHEGNEPGQSTHITYNQLLSEVCRLANTLKRLGVSKGDTVCIYMPMIPQAAYAMLACARIGAIHTVVFGGFSSDALSSRINDAKCKVVITANEGKRGPKTYSLKHIVDEALRECPSVKSVLIFQHTSAPVELKPGRDLDYTTTVSTERPYSPCEEMDSEDLLFMLYTSGSTGKPKGVVHTQAGYLLMVSLTHKYVFDLQPDDIYACVADIGWITGHSYIVYGPLCNGSTTLVFESHPTYPNPGRYWDLIQRHKIFYSAPTAIRALMKFGTEPVSKYNLDSLRVLGTVGEPINPAAWEWYFENIGKSKCAIVDTYWQTETGSIIMTPLPGCTDMKPGSCTFPFFGIEPVLLDQQTGSVVSGPGKGILAIKSTWPSVTRTIFGNHQRYLDTYMNTYPSHYFTGDGAYRDTDGYYWIYGRVDDVLNVAGHRLGTAEIESALVCHESCSEAAVVGIPNEIKGQSIFAYCCLKEGYTPSIELEVELKQQVRRVISAIAQPDYLVIVPGLPKTRSGKILRRILRKIASKETDLGDITTLAEKEVVSSIVEIVEGKLK